MIRLADKAACCGCTACASACPTGALTMEADADGFVYPKAGAGCTECGLCERVCPMLHPFAGREEPLSVACRVQDEALRAKSTSGGLFTAVASRILERGGAVYGAAFDADFSVRYARAESLAALAPLRGSKYVQADAAGVFAEIRDLLRAGRPVLFVGTPCQTAGLKLYLPQALQDGLYTADFICMGTASNRMWTGYLDAFYGPGRVREVFFKDKRIGWHSFLVRIRTDRRTTYARGGDDPFMNGYLAGLYLRPSCYACRHKGIARAADFTLADAWGIDKVAPEADDNKGLNCLLVHSEKGRALYESVLPALYTTPFSAADVARYNKHSVQCAKENPASADFYALLQSRGVRAALRRYCRPGLRERIINRLRTARALRRAKREETRS